MGVQYTALSTFRYARSKKKKRTSRKKKRNEKRKAIKRRKQLKKKYVGSIMWKETEKAFGTK